MAQKLILVDFFRHAFDGSGAGGRCSAAGALLLPVVFVGRAIDAAALLMPMVAQPPSTIVVASSSQTTSSTRVAASTAG
jgi:hypothetical protein